MNTTDLESTDIVRVLVLGAGLMGGGIAQVYAQSGYEVDLVDVTDEALARGRAAIEKSLARMVKSHRISADQQAATLGHIACSTDLAAAAGRADFVVEAVSEDFTLKAQIFAELDASCRESVIFGSNTSQFSITSLAAQTSRPDRFIGTHWMNPPPVMRLVEVIKGEHTSDDTLESTLRTLTRCNKDYIVCLKDTQGFVTSRLTMMLNLEAVRILEEGIADVSDINKACVLAFNHAMGPLDTLDLAGLDTALAVGDSMRKHFGERFLVPQTLRRLVNAGHLGRKTGRGFRTYEGGTG